MRVAVADYPDPLEVADLTSWKKNLSLVCAIVLGFIFMVSGGWKIFDPFKTGELLE